MSKTYSKTRTLVECALMIALGTVLANIKIYELPNGGSITLFSMLPFIMISFRHGVKWGLFTLEFVDFVGAVVGKVEERPLAGSVEADAGIRSGLADLLAGGELGVLVGHIAAAVIAVGDDGVDGGLEIILAADVQPGVAVDADELGAEDALAVVVVEDVPGHEQLQELVAA